MEQRLKQRLIGAVVLVALAVIFIPMLLKGPVDGPAADLPIEIPPKPRVEAVPGVPAPAGLAESRRQPQATPVYGDAQKQAQEPEEEPVEQPAPERAEAGSEPEPEVDDTPAELAGWAVQVGSFARQANALGLRDKLRESDLSAFVDVRGSGDSARYRVRVGPLLDRDEAAELQAVLQREHGLEGLLVSHP